MAALVILVGWLVLHQQLQNIAYYAKIVEEKSILRRLIRTATEIAQEGYNREDEVDSLLTEAEKSIMEVSQKKNSGAFHHIKDVLFRTYDNIETLHNRVGDVTGIATGFAERDKITAGFQRNDLIIVGARPSMGKTAFALNIAQNVATKTGENVAILVLRWGRTTGYAYALFRGKHRCTAAAYRLIDRRRLGKADDGDGKSVKCGDFHR